MDKKRPSLDGFIRRDSTGSLGEGAGLENRERPEHTAGSARGGQRNIGVQSTETTVRSAGDIHRSLDEIDAATPPQKPTRRERRKARRARPYKHPKLRRIIIWSAIGLLLIALAAAGYLAYKASSNTEKAFDGSIFDIVKKQALKEDANGRSNFVIFGTAEDDEGGEHGGANLTDSIMVLSVDQDKNDAYMVSVPRDLWVKYDDACSVGYEGKINAVYFCGSDDGTNEEAGAAALQAKVGEILGLDIQYYIHLNFTAVVEAVDAVGGVQVTIESEDSRGILDRNFDWKCNYTCYYVNYENGQTVQLDGEHALALARARNASGGYGLPNGNFDREKNQQKIIKALREKALSAGTLTNLGKVTGLMDAMGNNLRTNIQTKEIQTAMTLASETKTEDIRSLSLVGGVDGDLVTTGMISGQSSVYPTLGYYDYSGIQAFIAKSLSSDPVIKEAAKIVVLNGTNTTGVAQTEANKLKAKGYTIGAVDNAPDGTYPAVSVYQIGTGNTATAAALKELYGVELLQTAPPVAVADDVSFVVVIGSSAQ